ncbi:hypothetical protein Tsubulata_043306 [Turnera subulata]|uniref:Glycosyltransferases n=1 Tax=Turnera subulata TaxID=218843 RepID=A0A9Q0JDH6_9ROSI|nr:hypothetical protein Tsubulata_043306 [Turnera subulata]
MASIRRALSPVPRAGTLLSGEVAQVASPLSKSSSAPQQYPASGGLLSSLFGISDAQALVLGVLSPRFPRSAERPKSKGPVWRRALLHFFVCFVVGFFVGLTPFHTMNLSKSSVMLEHQAFSFDAISTVGDVYTHADVTTNVTSEVESGNVISNGTLEQQTKSQQLVDGTSNGNYIDQSLPVDVGTVFGKLLIVVTPTYVRPFQAYYLNRLGHALRLVQPPLLWIVVEMTAQSEQTADILRRTGVMYRHLVCSANLTDVKDQRVHQRNVALSHIETHRLDGIVHFADDNNVYSTDIFEQMRQIRRFGVWTEAKVIGKEGDTFIEGPVCSGTQVIGWHVSETSKRIRRFPADISGFAFNSTIIWDPKRWHRPTIESIRQLDTVKDGFEVSTFVEQLVEDESQMEGLLDNCSNNMVWHQHLESSISFFPPKWFISSNLDAVPKHA